MSRTSQYILSIASGIMLSLAWIGFPGWTLFIALIPLLVLEQFFYDNRSIYHSISFWAYSLLTFIIWNGISTWWIAYATIIGAVMAIIANSLLMSVVWWIAHVARRQLKTDLGYLALIVFWVSFEFFHYHWDIEWPWLNLGNGFANNVKIVQWYEYTGVLGGTLWVLGINILIFRIYKGFQYKFLVKEYVIRISFFIILFLGPILSSLIIYSYYSEKEDPFDVVVIQPNIDPYDERYNEQAELEKLQKFLDLADSVTCEHTDLVVGPETVFERYFDWREENLDHNFYFRQLSDWLRRYPNTGIIFGASTSKIYSGDESISETARKSDDIYYDVFNTAVFCRNDGDVQFYHKSILVSGVEKMPFRRYIGFLNDLVFDLGGTTGSLGRQEEPSNFILHDGRKLAPVICYESVFGGYLAHFVRKGAGMIIVITNDGWWRNTSGYKQHLSFARLRAIETRRSVVRAANTGISCFIDQRGDILERTEWWREAALRTSVNYNDEKLTFYVKNGDYIGRISLFLSVLMILLMIVKGFIDR